VPASYLFFDFHIRFESYHNGFLLMDDNTGELEQLKIERERDRIFGPRAKYERNTNDQGSSKRILEGLIVIAIVSLIAAVWNLTQTVTLLSAAQESQRREIDRMERRQDSLEGKLTRGDTNALDKQ
jgi:hypothetical protein